MTKTNKNLLIAPCGMNCGICLAFLREKNKCVGCRRDDPNKSGYCLNCKIKNCDKLQKKRADFCFVCEEFPCAKLKHLDKRYRTKYNMSMIENLISIKNIGIRKFLKAEKLKWACSDCGGVVCVHRGYCLDCKIEK